MTATFSTPRPLRILLLPNNGLPPTLVLQDQSDVSWYQSDVRCGTSRLTTRVRAEVVRCVDSNPNLNLKPNPNKKQARLLDIVDEEVGMAVMATNVVGVGRTCRAFLPLLRESGAGRLVLIGSYFGSIAGALGAGHLYYEASKHAVEGMADNLRRSEAANGAGVRVSLVKPANIVTGMNPKPYGEDEPAVVVRAVRHALGPSPKRRYLAGRVKGWPVGLLCWIFTHMPSWLTDNLM